MVAGPMVLLKFPGDFKGYSVSYLKMIYIYDGTKGRLKYGVAGSLKLISGY